MARGSWFRGGTLKKEKKSKKRSRSSMFRTTCSARTADMSVAGFAASYVDPEEERDPPLPATLVTFPAYKPVLQHDGLSAPELQSLYAKILKPSDISDQHVQALGINISDQYCTLDELLRDPDGQSYLPPVKRPSLHIGLHPDTVLTMDDVLRERKRSALDERVAELQFDNDTAYRTLSRNLKEGGAKPRKLAYMRKFFEGLETMSRYWECGEDNYYEAESLCSGKGVKRMRLDKDEVDSITPKTTEALDAVAGAPSDDHGAILPTPEPSPEPTSAPLSCGQHTATDKEPTTQAPSSSASSTPASPISTTLQADREFPLLRADTASPEPRSRQRYKGRRTHTGSEMPDQFRINTVRAFVEATAMPFQCTSTPPRVPPLVKFGKLHVPVAQTSAIYRQPTDRTRARQGRLEGPLVAVQVRPKTKFQDEAGQPLEAMVRLDMVREIGGLLQIAQERRRSGREVRSGEGQWWTTKPRWGGGSGYDADTDTDADGEAKATELASIAGEVANDGLVTGDLGVPDKVEKKPKIMARALPWKELRCGRGYWDPKIDYGAIGKDRSSSSDVVFMVSSLNHHISIVKLTVHDTYTDSLVAGKSLEDRPKPTLQRSQWFDLFDPQQRVEALRGIWGVMAYLTRESGVGAR
ncbi:hypothetical protein LTR56_022227 [Elasticomyces elasticus]|nr:hypothetical protein LTR56_022227 [Elasticomyces elasticus]KAK3632417.1 hypothetical protein LTR22_020602 [Elasticomyces elasticus]KAK4917244.1 hypothetical protein LTR49_014865 [Elasticomyces elasticus]